MKYKMFKAKVEHLGDQFSVLFTDYVVYVYCEGEEVARINTTVPYNLVAQNCYAPKWGTEELHRLCFDLCTDLAKTLPKNRGYYPARADYAGLVMT